MKHLLVFACLLPALMLTACDKKAKKPATTEPTTRVCAFQDSTKLAFVDLRVEVPTGQDPLSAVIRDSVETCAERYFVQHYSSSNPYTGDKTDIQAMLSHYGQNDVVKLTNYFMSTWSLTEADLQNISEDQAKWYENLSLLCLADNEAYTVYGISGGSYSGGAHESGVTPVTMTFDKRAGHAITRLVREDAAPDMQHLLRKGLRQFFGRTEEITDEWMLENLGTDENGNFRLPKTDCYPNATGDSLIFTYDEYEIASYAEGMPTFTLPVSELMPYLTKEAQNMLKK